MTTTTEWRDIAQANIERNLADSLAEYEGEDESAAAAAIGQHVYILAFDALADAGCPRILAQAIAQEMSLEYIGGPTAEEE